jgi:hypothetical protein
LDSSLISAKSYFKAAYCTRLTSVCNQVLAGNVPPPPGYTFVTLAGSAGYGSADGSGSAHLSLKIPTIADGTSFDLVFRVSDSLTAPANDLRTGCFTVTTK